MPPDRRQKALPGWDLEPETPEPTPPAAPAEEPQAAATPPESLAGQTVYVVDSHSLLHQVFHALPEMTSPKGEPVGAVFGFARDLFYLLETKKPDYLFFAFDLPGKTFRHELYEDYKVNRPAMDADLAPQFASVKRLLADCGLPVVECPGFEADDVLATIARVVDELG